MRQTLGSGPAISALLLLACGGAPPEPAEAPPQPGPIVLYRPPAAPPAVPVRPAAPAPAVTPAPPAAASLPPAAAPNEPSVACALAGRATFPANTPIQNAEGRAIARLSGAETPVSVTHVTLANAPRVYLATGAGRGGVRVRGYVEARAVPLFTTRSVPVFAGHLAIGERRAVTIAGAAADGKIKLEKLAPAPLAQSFTAWANCAALTLEPGTPPGWSPPGHARGYVLRQSSVELFDAPQGNPLGMLHKAPESAGVLFFSSEQTGGWVRLEQHGEIEVNAWARAGALSALPRGETLDQLATLPPVRGPAQLALQGTPRVVKVAREVLLRVGAKDTDPIIGLVEPEAELYVMDVMAGWVSVLPRTLALLPPENAQFWVKKSDLGR